MGHQKIRGRGCRGYSQGAAGCSDPEIEPDGMAAFHARRTRVFDPGNTRPGDRRGSHRDLLLLGQNRLRPRTASTLILQTGMGGRMAANGPSRMPPPCRSADLRWSRESLSRKWIQYRYSHSIRDGRGVSFLEYPIFPRAE
jgi:hypothetical protein